MQNKVEHITFIPQTVHMVHTSEKRVTSRH